VAVTASAFGTRQDARVAGCIEYLPKPVRAEALFAVLRDHLGALSHVECRRVGPDVELSRAARRRSGAVAAAVTTAA
jgi:hypothetical protein